jgi:hypothetical protein
LVTDAHGFLAAGLRKRKRVQRAGSVAGESKAHSAAGDVLVPFPERNFGNNRIV